MTSLKQHSHVYVYACGTWILGSFLPACHFSPAHTTFSPRPPPPYTHTATPHPTPLPHHTPLHTFLHTPHAPTTTTLSFSHTYPRGSQNTSAHAAKHGWWADACAGAVRAARADWRRRRHGALRLPLDVLRMDKQRRGALCAFRDCRAARRHAPFACNIALRARTRHLARLPYLTARAARAAAWHARTCCRAIALAQRRIASPPSATPAHLLRFTAHSPPPSPPYLCAHTRATCRCCRCCRAFARCARAARARACCTPPRRHATALLARWRTLAASTSPITIAAAPLPPVPRSIFAHSLVVMCMPFHLGSDRQDLGSLPVGMARLFCNITLSLTSSPPLPLLIPLDY